MLRLKVLAVCGVFFVLLLLSVLPLAAWQYEATPLVSSSPGVSSFSCLDSNDLGQVVFPWFNNTFENETLYLYDHGSSTPLRTLDRPDYFREVAINDLGQIMWIEHESVKESDWLYYYQQGSSIAVLKAELLGGVALNAAGQFVVTYFSRAESELYTYLFLYDHGTFSLIAHNVTADRPLISKPDINDLGQVAWIETRHYASGGYNSKVKVYDHGSITTVYDIDHDGATHFKNPSLNDDGLVAWLREYWANCTVSVYNPLSASPTVHDVLENTDATAIYDISLNGQARLVYLEENLDTSVDTIYQGTPYYEVFTTFILQHINQVQDYVCFAHLSPDLSYFYVSKFLSEGNDEFQVGAVIPYERTKTYARYYLRFFESYGDFFVGEGYDDYLNGYGYYYYFSLFNPEDYYYGVYQKRDAATYDYFHLYPDGHTYGGLGTVATPSGYFLTMPVSGLGFILGNYEQLDIPLPNQYLHYWYPVWGNVISACLMDYNYHDEP